MYLLDLPRELLLHIISFLDVEPPSLRKLRREPSLTLTESKTKPLKNLSLTSRTLRRLAFLSLFRYTRLSVANSVEIVHESHIVWDEVQEYVRFIKKNALSAHVQGHTLLTAVILDPSSATIPSKFPTLDEWSKGLSEDTDGSWGFSHVWQLLLGVINPMSITTVAPPSTLSQISSTEVRNGDEWAFDMPLHILHLKRAEKSDSRKSAKHFSPFTLFHLRPWSHVTLNEGSSLKAYCTYHYHQKQTPSITSLGQDGFITKRSLFNVMCPTIKSFTYVAIFPFGKHVRNVLRFCLTAMPALDSFSIQLAPDPKSGILEDESRTQMNYLRDAWMEAESGYYHVATAVALCDRPFRFKEFRALDYSNKELRKDLDQKIGGVMSSWSSCGGGVWKNDGVGDVDELTDSGIIFDNTSEDNTGWAQYAGSQLKSP